MPERILNIVNAVLVLVCAWFIFYLATAKYTEPKDIAQARKILDETDTRVAVAVTRTVSRDVTLNASMFDPIYTPTPTPTPTPSPTPAPPNLREAVYAWTIMQMKPAENMVIFRDDRTKTPIKLTIGDKPYQGEAAKDKSGRNAPVQLIQIDKKKHTASLLCRMPGYEDQIVVMDMFAPAAPR